LQFVSQDIDGSIKGRKKNLFQFLVYFVTALYVLEAIFKKIGLKEIILPKKILYTQKKSEERAFREGINQTYVLLECSTTFVINWLSMNNL
jgi:hypothetical protein